jgi:hypothetical protein
MDWQVGDRAVCVDDSPHPTLGESGIIRGRAYTIISIRHDGNSKYGRGRTAFQLASVNPPWWATKGFDAVRFCKIRPDEQEACEPEFVTLLKRSKRKVPASAVAATSGETPNTSENPHD